VKRTKHRKDIQGIITKAYKDVIGGGQVQ